MDPNAAAAIMRDGTISLDERIEAAQNLRSWLDNGGYPQGMLTHDGKHRTFGGNTAARFAAVQEVALFLSAAAASESTVTK